MDWESIRPRIEEFLWKWGPSVVGALATLILGWIGARIVRGILRRILLRAKVDPTLVGFATSLVYMALMAFVIVAALDKVGVPTGSFIAIVGAAGLAVGFALQGSLGNFAAGVMVIFFRPFKAGDFIEGGGVAGVVEEITVFSTFLKTPDNKRIIVPNATLTGGNIINYSANPTRRVDLVFGISYSDDIAQAKEILTRIVTGHEKVLKDPAPQIVVGALADSSVNFNVRPWVKNADYWTVYFEITEAVKLAFDKEGVSIPFPQRDVHLHQVA